MDKNETVNTTLPAVEETTTTPPVVVEDAEARITALEAEKARLIEEAANWKVAALKYKKKEDPEDTETSDERMARIAAQAIADSRLADIAREQDAIIKKALKENRELKLAHLNKTTTTPPAAVGTHTEGQPVKDTLVTQEQLNAFKARGWSDKDIERYKKNLQRYK